MSPQDAARSSHDAPPDRMSPALTFEMIDGGVFSAEDLYISEQIQLGVAAQAGDGFVLGRCEQHLRRFHANLDALLRA